MAQAIKRKWPGLLLSLFLIGFWFTASATAFELNLGLSSGYDDNPRQEENSEGALFTQSELDLSWTLPQNFFPATSISLYGFAAYQCYSGLEDNWQLGGGLASAVSLRIIPGVLSFFSEAGIYRNPLISDNDYDSLSLGTTFTWFAGSRLNIELGSSLDWEAYRDRVVSGRHPHSNPHNSGRQAQTHKPPPAHNLDDRNDRLFTTSLKSLYAFSPDFDGTGTVFWRYRHSSIDSECRRAYGLNLDLNWRPLPAVAIDWQLGGERVPYKYKYHKQSRTENIYNLGVMLSWYRRNLTLQAGWDWNKRNSDINEDDYQQNQWQIRLKYSY